MSLECDLICSYFDNTRKVSNDKWGRRLIGFEKKRKDLFIVRCRDVFLFTEPCCSWLLELVLPLPRSPAILFLGGLAQIIIYYINQTSIPEAAPSASLPAYHLSKSLAGDWGSRTDHSFYYPPQQPMPSSIRSKIFHPVRSTFATQNG